MGRSLDYIGDDGINAVIGAAYNFCGNDLAGNAAGNTNSLTLVFTKGFAELADTGELNYNRLYRSVHREWELIVGFFTGTAAAGAFTIMG